MVVEPLCKDYDMKTYWGRLKYFALQSSPEHMFTTDDDIENARECLRDACSRNDFGVTVANQVDKPATVAEAEAVAQGERIWNARFILCGATHPSSEDTIPTPFRMGSWVAMGTFPITGLMATALSPTASVLRIGALQWWNQSINASINYYNGSALASGEEATNVFMQGYFGACAAAVGIGMGLGRACANMPALKSVQRYAPYPAVALANVFNTYLVRRHETEQGVEVRIGGSDGEVRSAETLTLCISICTAQLFHNNLCFLCF